MKDRNISRQRTETEKYQEKEIDRQIDIEIKTNIIPSIDILSPVEEDVDGNEV